MPTPSVVVRSTARSSWRRGSSRRSNRPRSRRGSSRTPSWVLALNTRFYSYVSALSTVDEPRPQWRRTGPLQLTAAVRAGEEPDVRILPAWTFLTQTVRGEPVTGGQPYGEHFFSSTAERNANFQGARPYPDGKFA